MAKKISNHHKKGMIKNFKISPNKIATIIETKLVCKEPGKLYIIGQSIDENGHVKPTDPFFWNRIVILDGPPLQRQRRGGTDYCLFG